MNVWKRSMITAAVLVASSFAVVTAHADDVAKVGKPAPAFTAKDSEGKTRNLSDFKGRYVVLEWHNQGCPFVKKHYDSGNMQRLQKELTEKGAIWLTVISSAEGKQGYVSPEDEQLYLFTTHAAPTAVLFDADGKIGHAYGAKTTPHMFVIDNKGVLIYAGAIDDNPSSDPKDTATAKNYVKAAFEEASASKPVTTATTAPYGCSVKYQD
jgi:peroxiredoxin